jgi:hypothetical protein
MNAKPSRHLLELIENGPELRAKFNPLKTMLTVVEARNAELMKEKEKRVLDLQYQLAQREELSKSQISRLEQNVKDLENQLSASKAENSELEGKLDSEKKLSMERWDLFQEERRKASSLRKSKTKEEKEFSSLKRKWESMASYMSTIAEKWGDGGVESEDSQSDTTSDSFVEHDEETDSDEEFEMPPWKNRRRTYGRLESSRYVWTFRDTAHPPCVIA